MVLLHVQTLFVLISPSEQETVVIKTEQTPGVIYLSSNNLINNTEDTGKSVIERDLTRTPDHKTKTIGKRQW